MGFRQDIRPPNAGEKYRAAFRKAHERSVHFILGRYDDGRSYKPHFVTARQMYNIIKAVEEGKRGDPHLYRNYLLHLGKNLKIPEENLPDPGVPSA